MGKHTSYRSRIANPVALVLGGIALCGVFGFMVGSLHKNPDKSPQQTTAAAPHPPQATPVSRLASGGAEPLPTETLGPVLRPNTWVTDGVMQYDVVNQKCVVKLCLVSVRVRNRSLKPLVFSPADQVGYGPDGTRYPADPAATQKANGTQRTFLDPLRPWQLAAGQLAFGLPKSQKLSAVRLRTSATQASVTIQML